MADQFSDRVNNLIETLWGFVSQFVGTKSESVLGVDIGSSSIKVVQLKRKKGRAVLETYGEIALGPYAGFSVGQATSLPVEKISEALQDVLREANVTTKNSAFSIPLASSLISVIQLPKISERKLKEVIPIEARKYIPVPISEVALDWWVIPKSAIDESGPEKAAGVRELSKDQSRKRISKNKIDILLVAIHNETINRYQGIAEKNKLKARFLEIETFSAIRALAARNLLTFLILDIGASSTKVAIVERGVVLNSHIITRGSQDITVALSKSLGISIMRAEEMKREVGLVGGSDNKVHSSANVILNSLFSEVNRILLNYEKRYNRTASKVVLAGGGSLLKGIQDLAQEEFDTEVVYGNPFVKVDTPAFLGTVLEEVGPSFAVSLGLALRQLGELE